MKIECLTELMIEKTQSIFIIEQIYKRVAYVREKPDPAEIIEKKIKENKKIALEVYKACLQLEKKDALYGKGDEWKQIYNGLKPLLLDDSYRRCKKYEDKIKKIVDYITVLHKEFVGNHRGIAQEFREKFEVRQKELEVRQKELEVRQKELEELKKRLAEMTKLQASVSEGTVPVTSPSPIANHTEPPPAKLKKNEVEGGITGAKENKLKETSISSPEGKGSNHFSMFSEEKSDNKGGKPGPVSTPLKK